MAAGDGPPSTRKEYAAVRNMEVPGERAAVSGKAANGGRGAAAPTDTFTGASAAAKRGAGPFVIGQTPACTTPQAGDMRKKRRNASRALVPRPPRRAILLFPFSPQGGRGGSKWRSH